MTINLAKGNRVNLTKDAPGVQKFAIGLSWSPPTTGGAPFDLDASAFACAYNASGDPILVSDKHLIFYGMTDAQGQPLRPLASPCGGIVHSGDNLTGDGDGDDELIVIDTGKLDAKIEEISIIVTIHDAIARGQNFGQVKKPVIRIFNPDDGVEILKYELDEDYSGDRSIQFGSIYKKDGTWRFNALGVGCGDRSLGDFVAAYGPTLAVANG